MTRERYNDMSNAAFGMGWAGLVLGLLVGLLVSFWYQSALLAGLGIGVVVLLVGALASIVIEIIPDLKGVR